MAARNCVLKDTITSGRFFSLSEHEILHQIGDSFAEELERLKAAYAVEKGGSPQLLPHDECSHTTPSQILYHEDFDEINRTLTGVLALKWIYDDNYAQFTSGQAPKVRLTKESFSWLRTFFTDNLKSADDLFTLILSMIVNDLGKDPNLEESYYFATGKTLKGANHDTILLEAAKAGIVSSLDMLGDEHRKYVMLGLELGSELNAGQLAQAENVPINLEGLLDMKGHDHAFNLKFMEQILDVSGAAAHYDPRGARSFIEPVFHAFKTVHEVALDIIAGKCNLRQGYDKVLTKRGDMLFSKGYKRLSVDKPEERALLRLLTMGRTSTLEQAQLFERAFNALDTDVHTRLVTGLNIDGMPNETAVLPYYMPAMISACFENTKSLPTTDQERALTSLMRYLARVLEIGDEEWSPLDGRIKIDQRGVLPWNIPKEPPIPGIVIERNMLKARATISSHEFRTNPDLLDELEIPKGHILQRRRTSHTA